MRSIAYCLVLLAATTAVWASGATTVDARMQGSAQLAAPSLSAAWLTNPAGLADLNASAQRSSDTPMAGMVHEASIGHEISGGQNSTAINWGGNMPESALGLGFGAGWTDSDWGSQIGAGVGIKLPVSAPLAVGLAARYTQQDYAGIDDELVFCLALRGAIPVRGPRDVAVYYALALRDVTDRYYRAVEMGVSATFDQRLTVALDLVDVTDERNRAWLVGARYELPTTTPVAIGAGVNDGDLAAGFEVTLPRSTSSNMDLKLGLAWQDGSDDSWLIGARAAFGL